MVEMNYSNLIFEKTRVFHPFISVHTSYKIEKIQIIVIESLYLHKFRIFQNFRITNLPSHAHSEFQDY